MTELKAEISSTTYPGRGIIIGRSADGKKAVTGYFIMGRSENSRNRVFVAEGKDLKTQAFDPSKLVDPSLIIYAPVRTLENATIVTNGDQTDTIRDFILEGKTFEDALRTRTFYSVSSMNMHSPLQARDILSIHTSVTAIRYPHLKVSLSL